MKVCDDFSKKKKRQGQSPTNDDSRGIRYIEKSPEGTDTNQYNAAGFAAGAGTINGAPKEVAAATNTGRGIRPNEQKPQTSSMCSGKGNDEHS